MARVVIHGGGTAAHCTAHLLHRAGIAAELVPTDRRPLPALLLSSSAIALIESVLGRLDLFRHAHRIDRRVVQWEPRSEARSFPHTGVVTGECDLVGELAERLEPQTATSEPNWSVISTRELVQSARPRTFGTRIASATWVGLANRADASACWIESVENGWLFLLPDSPDSGWLLAVGSPADDLIQESRLIRSRLGELDREGPTFPAHPRVSVPLCGADWLACGTAAMAFDPICGDGTAHAVREAVLASAVIRAAEGGEEPEKLLPHYQARMMAGFERHLVLCRQFYRTGFGGEWWDTEAAALDAGLAWCREQRAEFSNFQFRLQGSELVAVN